MPTFSAFGRDQRQFSSGNLPYFFLILTIALGFVAVALTVMTKLAMAKESDLKSVAGSVQQAPEWLRGNGGKLPIILIRVVTDDGLYDLDEFDLSHSGEVMNLRPGDRITARVRPLATYHSVWELKRDGVTIQSYQETRLFQAAQNAQSERNALLSVLAASISLTVALALRIYFGAWRVSTTSPPAAAAGFVQGAVRLPNYPPLNSADYPRTYYMSQSWEAFHLLVGFGAIGAGVSVLRSTLAGPQVRVTLVWGILWGILFPIIGIMAVLYSLKYHVVLFADRIEVHNLVSTQVLRRDEIAGRRLLQGGRYYGPCQTMLLLPQDAQWQLRVLLVLKTDSAFWEWMDPIPDLDALL